MIELVKTIIYCIYFLIELLIKRSPDDGIIGSSIKSVLSVKIIKWMFLVITVISLICNAILFPRVIYLAYVIKTLNQRHDKQMSEIQKVNEDIKKDNNQNAQVILSCNHALVECEKSNAILIQRHFNKSNK